MTIAELLQTVAKPVAALLVMAAAAHAQGMPPGSPGTQNPVCVRLEGQLVALERGTPDPASSDQVRRYEEAANRQQVELDRTVAQSRRMGCEGSGFFLFGLGQPQQCDQLNSQIQRMRANLDRILADLQQLRGGSGQTEGQRRAILAALAQNSCGPQYRTAAPAAPSMPQPPSGFFGSLFGSAPQMPGGDPNAVAPGSGGFRTVCVRTCDGYFFPVSQLTTPAKFGDDEQACRRLCPATDVALYTYRVPGEDVSQAVSAAGRPYTELPNAFRYRQEFNPSCSCRRAGESWNDALKNTEDRTVEHGDVIVTEEKAKQLSQPKPDAPPQVKQTNRKGNTRTPGTPDEAAAAPRPSLAPAAPAATAAPVAAAPATPPEPTAAPRNETGKRSVRTVGPQFLPAR